MKKTALWDDLHTILWMSTGTWFGPRMSVQHNNNVSSQLFSACMLIEYYRARITVPCIDRTRFHWHLTITVAVVPHFDLWRSIDTIKVYIYLGHEQTAIEGLWPSFYKYWFLDLILNLRMFRELSKNQVRQDDFTHKTTWDSDIKLKF